MRLCLTILVAVCLTACKQGQVIPEPVIEVQGPQSGPIQPKKPARATMLEQLLEQADAALARERLTIPAADNAYDKYRAALLLEPASERAQAGLDAVLTSLVALARDELARGRLGRAQTLLETASERFPQAALTADLALELDAARAALELERERAKTALVADDKVHLIPAEYLREASDEARQWFASVAEGIKSEDASILIFARSDAEGRKIYRLLKSEITDYLLRGDIRIGTPARIQEMEPLP